MKNRSHQRKVRHPFERILTLLCLLVLVTAPRAQQHSTAKQPPADRVALYQALLDLTNPWTVMCIAAHPDDEDGTSLIVMRRKYGAHTVSLFTTFGEGGQNAIGPELYEELGAIRVRETMAASEIQGSEPYFLGMKDFGFSKSADEAFKVWGHDEALRRMVLQIRKLRPDVIITNHSVTNNDHGHHQATARLTVEAFDAAADPKRFPEQLKDGLTVWQVQRLFVRARGNAQAQAAPAPTVTIDPNERDPIREATFAEEALRGLQQHATQGPWPKTVAELASRFRLSTDGKLPLTRYVLVREANGDKPLPRDLRSFLEGLNLPEKTSKLIELPTVEGHPLIEFAGDRSKVLVALLRGLRAGFYGFSYDKTDEFRLLWMRERLERALAIAAGITLQAEPARRVAASGATFDLTVKLSNAGIEDVRISGCGASLGPMGGFLVGDKLAAGSELRRKVKVKIPNNAPVNVPLSSHLYDSSNLGLRLTTSCSIDLPNGDFKIIDSEPIDVAPEVEIANISPEPLVITPNTPAVSRSFLVTLTNHRGTPATGRLAVTTNVSPLLRFENGPSFSLSANETKRIELPLGTALGTQNKGQRTTPQHTGMIPLSILLFNGTNQSSSLTRSVQAVVTDARVSPNLRVGYLRGFDYSLPNALSALGVESKELSVDEVKTADLSKYTSIIVDNRVYESEPRLIEANQKLLDYANAGGTLIVFYHKSDEWNPDERRKRPQLAPYKLILGNERITDENASVTFLEPQHPLLNSPNKLGPEDFANWIQERGLYYPKEWDPQFHALLQSNDPGEAPLKGGLLVADYGRGHYIYSSMVWYRELRAGVPGAYRMLANMISYGAGK
jgi:LmbE family N-acetylglucosaminyl deacetylase